MAGGFWKALGSKLVETGAAYLEQVRLVNELKQLTPKEAQARFANYVQGLSGAARAGFALTLTTLASRETNAQTKHFIESLRTALANPTATAKSPPADPVKPAARAVPPPAAPPPVVRRRATFDEDVTRVSSWYDEFQGEARVKAATVYLDALDVDGLGGLRTNLETMLTNCAVNIKSHRENEARIAGGRFVEDQMSYNMSVLRTGQHDPDWQRQLGVLYSVQQWFEQLHQAVGHAIEQRRRPAPPPPAPPPPAPPPAAPVKNETRQAVAGLKQLLEEQLRSGEVRSDRATALRRTLEKIEGVLAAAERGEIDAEQVTHRIQQMYGEAAHMFADPGTKARVAHGDARLRRIDGYAGAMKAALGRELMTHPPTATEEALASVLGDVGTFQKSVADAADDDALAQLESEVLRPAARALHELATTRHALIARPLWESIDVLPQVNAVAYSGADDLRRKLAGALAARRLTVGGARQLQHYGQARWDELNTCHLAVFDLRGASEIASLATRKPKRARELTAAAYELGLAFALGKPLVVVGGPGETMPFDIDLAPVSIGRGKDTAAHLQAAVDAAFYEPQRSSRGSSIAQSIAFIDHLSKRHEKRRAFEGMGWLDPALATDPAAFAAKTELLLRELPAPPWRLLRPAWPAAYPDPAPRRCFHVMPFGPDWADTVRDHARVACQERGFAYRRGDEAEEGRIIHAIWDDLCRASVVLVDLTGTNLNVMIELGIAHGIGRPVIAVQQRDTVDVRPRHIEKVRVLPYESPADLPQLVRPRLPD